MNCRCYVRRLVLSASCLWCATLGLHGHGDVEIRIAAVTQRIQSATNNVAALFLERGNLHREHQDWLAAAADYAHAEKLGADSSSIDFCRANLFVDAGKLVDAEAAFSKAIAEAPANGAALIGRARVRAKLERRNLAIEDYENGVAALKFAGADVYLEFAHVLSDAQRGTDAIRVLEDGMKQAAPLSLHEYAFELELRQNQREAALARLEKILSIAERKEKWFARRGDLLLQMNRTTEARQSFIASLQAIDGLPKPVQQTPVTTQLITHIRQQLKQLTADFAAE